MELDASREAGAGFSGAVVLDGTKGVFLDFARLPKPRNTTVSAFTVCLCARDGSVYLMPGDLPCDPWNNGYDSDPCAA